MTDSARPAASVMARALRSFVLMLVGLPIVVWLVNTVSGAPPMDAAAWARLAVVAVPVLAVSTILESVANRWSGQLARVYGKGLAVAMIILVVGSGDRPEGWWNASRVTKTLLYLPVGAIITSVGFWGQERVFGREDENSEERAHV